MGQKLVIRFSGLCAFVPEKPIQNTQNEATVLLVNASQMHDAPHHTVFFASPEAYPELVHPGTYNRPIAFRFKHVDAGYAHACQLTGEELTVFGRTAGGTEVQPESWSLDFTLVSHSACPTPSDAKSFFWVSEMSKANAGAVNKNLLHDFDIADCVSMRMRLTQGTLSCGGFRTTQDNKIVLWNYGGTMAALAEEVLWYVDFPVMVDEIVFQSQKFKDCPEQPELVLKAVSNPVVARIFNMPLPDLLGFNMVDPLQDDIHFDQFFRLAEGSPEPKHPTPDRDHFCEGGIGAMNPKCPPTVFSPLTS